MSDQDERELERIRRAYEKRKRERPADEWAADKPVNVFFREGQERALARARIAWHGRRVLDVGCGAGAWLSRFEGYGVAQQDLAGIELDAERVARAKQQLPGADVRAGDASRLPWGDASFDVVTQFVVFSSVLDAGMRVRMATEMRRVLRRGGVIVWYDFFVNNPRNADVRGVRAGEIERLFPDCAVSLQKVTLAPPLARAIVPRALALARVLERLTWLNTHYLALVRPR